MKYLIGAILIAFWLIMFLTGAFASVGGRTDVSGADQVGHVGDTDVSRLRGDLDLEPKVDREAEEVAAGNFLNRGLSGVHAASICDQPIDSGHPNRAINLQDVGYVLSFVGTNCDVLPTPTPTPFTGTCYFESVGGSWHLHSNDIWPFTFDRAWVDWWLELPDSGDREPWVYYTRLTVTEGHVFSAIVDAHVPVGPGDVYAGVVVPGTSGPPYNDSDDPPYAAECEFEIPQPTPTPTP